MNKTKDIVILPDSFDLPTVNRCAFVLKPTNVFLNWIRECPEGGSDLTLSDLQEDVNLYLIPDTEDDPETWLENNYTNIFIYELSNWSMDGMLWPDDLSFKMFNKFFRISFHYTVIDLDKGPIVRNDL